MLKPDLEPKYGVCAQALYVRVNMAAMWRCAVLESGWRLCGGSPCEADSVVIFCLEETPVFGRDYACVIKHFRTNNA